MLKKMFAALLIAAFALSAMASDTPVMDRILSKKVLVVGTSGNMPPMTHRLKSGEVIGFDMDLAALMAGALGVELKVEVMPLDALVLAVKSGKVDVVISNMTTTFERNKHVAFSEPYLISGKCLVTKEQGMAKQDDPETVASKKPTLVVLEGSTSEQFAHALMKDAKLVSVDSSSKAIELVKSGKANAMLSEYPMCMSVVSGNPDAGFVAGFSTLSYEPIGIAMPGNDALFINWTQNFVTRIKATGAIEALLGKWLGQPSI